MGRSRLRPDGHDRRIEQIRHTDVYQTRRGHAHVRALSDPCGAERDRRVKGWCQKSRAAPMCPAGIDAKSTPGQVKTQCRDLLCKQDGLVIYSDDVPAVELLSENFN